MSSPKDDSLPDPTKCTIQELRSLLSENGVALSTRQYKRKELEKLYKENNIEQKIIQKREEEKVFRANRKKRRRPNEFQLDHEEPEKKKKSPKLKDPYFFFSFLFFSLFPSHSLFSFFLPLFLSLIADRTRKARNQRVCFTISGIQWGILPPLPCLPLDPSFQSANRIPPLYTQILQHLQLLPTRRCL